MSGDFLDRMAAGSRARVADVRTPAREAELRARARDLPPPPRLERSPQGFDLIAELKLRSPAAGQLRAAGEAGVEQRVSAYARAGAAAVSILTEPSRFDGSMAHLELAAATLAPLGVPAMRKDFLVDPFQVLEARVAGAGGVLVILRMLPRNELQDLIDRALELRLFVLLEAFDERDIELAHELLAAPDASSAELLYVGVNCRDLATLDVVPGRLEQLAPLLPTSVPRVAESGVGSAEDAARVAAAGYDLALVGSALMKGADPRALAAELLDAARAARRRRDAGALAR